MNISTDRDESHRSLAGHERNIEERSIRVPTPGVWIVSCMGVRHLVVEDEIEGWMGGVGGTWGEGFNKTQKRVR